MNILRVLAVAIGALLLPIAVGVARADEPVTVAQRSTIHSDVLGEDRTISVHLPSGYDKSQDRYPVLYVLDGEQLLIQISGVTETLSWGFRGPDIIVVAIHNVSRNRDFKAPLPGQNPTGDAKSGPDVFMKFLQTELVPAIERKYRTAAFRMIFGHSLGGLMALHSFVAAPGFFNATIASSPAIDYNGDYVVDRMKQLFSKGPRGNSFLFVSMAAREYDDSPRAFRKFQELLQLRAPQDLRWESKVIPDTDHGTVLLSAAQQGLEFIFQNWRDPALIFEEGVDSIEKFYKDMSNLYGMKILPPTFELDALGQKLTRANDFAGAVKVYERYVAIYPNDIDAHTKLANALIAAGNAGAARQEFEKALGLARQSQDKRTADIEMQLQKLKSATP